LATNKIIVIETIAINLEVNEENEENSKMSLLYRQFSLIKTELANNNIALAREILKSCKRKLKSDADLMLYNALHAKAYLTPEDKAKPEYTATTLADLDKREVIPGISIVSCCMNRNDNLKKALISWLKLPVDEIVIVDWSSSPSVADTISDIIDSRVKIIRVDNEPKWILTYGFNVGLRFASYSKVYKFDADIQVSEDFLALNQFNNTSFVRGYWKAAYDLGLDDQMYVNGSFGCDKEHLRTIGYYNELIRTYGWDDSDIYERLASQCGLKTQFLNFNSVLHLEQKENERTSNQDVITRDFLGKVKTTEFNNQRNKFIGRTTDHWNLNRLQNYSLEKNGNNVWLCRRITNDIHIPTYIIDNANIFAAIHFLGINQPKMFAKANSYSNVARLIFSEYQAAVNFETTQQLLGEIETEHLFYCFDDTYQNYDSFVSFCKQMANDKKTTIFGLCKGNEYQHKRFGYYGQFAELIVLPEELFEAVNQYRDENKLNIQNIAKVIKISKETFDQAFLKNNKRVIYADAQHGLGNRLRAIGSAAAIAKKSDRELVIVWQPDHHCECSFADLFDYDGLVIENSFTESAIQTMDVFNYMEIEDGSHKDKEVILNDDKDAYLRAAYTFKSELSDWDSENEFLRNLTPTSEIKRLVEAYDLTNCIAAHVRMEAGAGLDHNTYDSIENWTKEGHDELHFWRDKSHFSRFIKRIDQIFLEDSKLKLFLATDLPETYKIFEDYYGDRLIYLKRDVYDRSKEQIKFGLADAILLSKSQKLLGSTWSSFSELAMRLSKTYSSLEMSGKDF
jgi:hypothetical protein